ncbi:PREDICTED: putative late blight resistance protein homolog R1A-10 [Ipomoea nil]|uniref:putative late blight resistance protein homolog R1A-10 n=1 Tax=Ipomoea nil TaxID=35883 RepID=UPI000900EA96|nr:PREDICTED: putative late blight resistance protein homolog R1A-10 [Ipomoea nil]
MDTVVELLIGKVAESVEENASLILGIKDEVEDLLSELRSFKAYLTEASKNNESCNGNAVLRNVVQKIQKVIIDAEDAIDKYLVERRNHRTRPVLKRWAERLCYYTKVIDAAKEIESIKKRAEKIRLDHVHSLNILQAGSTNNPHPAVLQAPVVEEDEVIGFDTEAKIINDRLTEKLNDTMVISIVGMPGLGKTTLANMVFKDHKLHYESFTHLWIHVSSNMNRRQIFMDIISKLNKETRGCKHMSDDQLASNIKEFLNDIKYFIVMDDVCSTRDWNHLKIAFPNNQKGSRILVTTRTFEVANHVDSKNAPHELKYLELEESWELLEKKVFRKEACPNHLVSTGRSIAKKCNGIPLAVVVIAGVLDKNSTAAKWEEVAEDPFQLINQENQSYNELVSLSYNQLPNHTKDCFLYLAAFPMGHEIPVRKLICLWIAEGFIPSSSHNMEGTAKIYLKDFVNRNLLMVVKKTADGEIKSCRLPDTLHEFCKSEAMKNNLFHEIDGTRIEGNENYRRLCIRSNLRSFIDSESKPSGEHIRSLLTSTKYEIPEEHLATIPKSYPLLRVFDAEELKFEILPKEFYELYHLRYLAVTTDLKLFPKSFTNLWNTQTLVFNTSQTSVEVKAEIWRLTKLRHLLANASLKFPTPKNCRDKCEDLQTLSSISPKSCTEAIFDKMPNLLKMGVRGDLVELLEMRRGICLFDNIGNQLHKLQNLKLVHETANAQGSKLRSFPRAEKFPANLRKLTLANTSFEWKDICILGSLDGLEVLKLEEFAVKGDSWELNNTVFNSLQFLRIGRTDLAYWTAKETSFPALKKLYLLHCTNLNALPLAFKDVKALKFMELYCTNRNAATSARKIQNLKPEEHGLLELSVYPPDHSAQH